MSADWLSQLAPAHAPSAPGWWPPAPGWWGAGLLFVLLVPALVTAARWWREPRRRFRRAALHELRLIRASTVEGPAAARAIENLLRRYAMALYGRDIAARLTGAAWLEFASAAGAERLSGEAGRSLLAAAFGGSGPIDRESWLTAAAEFIRHAAQASRGRGR
jgi:Domain of unknown function (DUF4381)